MARCPRCKETVSQFAAGCAYCGYDLEQGRRDEAARRARRPAVPGRPSLPALPDWVVALGLLALATIFMPILGLLLTGFAIRRESLTTQGPLRIALWVLLAAGLMLLLSPPTRYGLIAALYGV